MIHFDFTLSDEDAENLFDILSEEISRIRLLKIDCIRPNLIPYYDERIEYINKLRKAMNNKKVI